MPYSSIFNCVSSRKKLLFLLLITTLLTTLISCGDNDDYQLNFTTIEQGTDSALATDLVQLFRATTQAEWDDLWAQHKANVTPPPQQPAVDFSRQMVIAVFDREQTSGGYSIEITQIKKRLERLAVFATRSEPGDNCATTTALTSPFHIVSVEPSDLDPELFLSIEIAHCFP